jgi:di/tricarboxylate transporter
MRSTPRLTGLKVLGVLLVSLLQLGLAYVVVGVPDWRAAADFLTSNQPTDAGAVAAAQALLWAVAAAAFATALVSVGREAVRGARRRGRNLAWSLAIMLAGLMVLAAGLEHHVQGTTLTMSGGSLQEARAELAR